LIEQKYNWKNKISILSVWILFSIYRKGNYLNYLMYTASVLLLLC
jgi:hypothetical protein